jgi:hypothetical protein
MQFGYAPSAGDPIVRAFAEDLMALQRICKIDMVPLAYEIANAGAAFQKDGAPASLLGTATQLRQFVSQAAQHDHMVIGSCAGLFDAFARSRVGTQGNGGGSGKHGKGNGHKG